MSEESQSGTQTVTDRGSVRTGMETFENLPPKFQLFALLIATGESQTNAVRRIRPLARCPKQQGSKWAKLPRVIAAIKELKADSRAAFADRELRHKDAIYNRANADRSQMAAAVLFGAEVAGLPKDPRDWPQELKDCIEGVEYTKYGPKVLLSDRNTASRLFSQHMGWMAERHELSGPNGEPLQSVVITTDDPVEAARLYQEMIQRKQA